MMSLNIGDGPDKAAAMEEGTTAEAQSPKQILKDYLLERVPVFQRLMELKLKGWQNPAGDAHFQKQRKSADTADGKTQRILFNMMIQIGRELDDATGAFSQLGASENDGDRGPINVLDLCMAPGGFSASILERRPTAHISGLSLPLDNGGHKMFVLHGDRDSRINVKYLDITMLTADLYPTSPTSVRQDDTPLIPTTHPSFNRLIPNTRPYYGTSPAFDLAICDGQVLRTHYPKPPNNTEPARLCCAQLVLALTRLKTGGTLVILLHKVDAWNSARLIQTVNSFSTGPVRLFKPERKHATRSSFYLVAKGVQPNHPAAQKAVEMWRRTWLAATLRVSGVDDQETGEDNLRGWCDWEEGEDVNEFLESFGERLIELGMPIWEIQANALAKAPYTKD